MTYHFEILCSGGGPRIRESITREAKTTKEEKLPGFKSYAEVSLLDFDRLSL